MQRHLGTDDRTLLIGIAIALLVALVADVAIGRYQRRTVRMAALAVLLLAALYGAFDWLRERPGTHFTNPTLSRQGDLLGHVVISVLFLAMPVLLGLAIAALLPRDRVTRAFRILLTGSGVLGSLFLALILALTLGVWIYHDGP